MAIIFEIIIGLIAEIIIQIIIEGLLFFGFDSLAGSFKEYKIANKYLAITGCFLLGGIVGLISYSIYPHPIVKSTFFPGISIIISPVFVGLVMKKLGDVRIKSGKRISILLTFLGGAVFAFAYALVRFLLTQSK